MKRYKILFITTILCLISSFYLYGKTIEQHYIDMYTAKQTETIVTYIYRLPFSYLIPLIIGVIVYMHYFKHYVISNREKEICTQIELINNGHYRNLEHTNNLNIYLNNLNRFVLFQKEEAMSIKKQMKSYIEDIAHQIKTPLTTLHIYVETSTDQKILDYGQKELLRVEGVVDEMIRLAKLEAHSIKFEFENVLLSEIVDQVLDDLNPLIENKNIQLIQNYNDLEICVDEMWMCEMLVNILKNSIEFSNANGVVYFTAKVAANKLIIEIEDEGTGFLKEEIPYIFDRFHQSDTKNVRKQKGMGIGLSISKEVIQAHHGNIYVDNTKKGGAIFILELPLVVGKAKI